MCKLSVERIKKHNFFVNRNTTKTQFQEDSNNYDFKTAMQSYTFSNSSQQQRRPTVRMRGRYFVYQGFKFKLGKKKDESLMGHF